MSSSILFKFRSGTTFEALPLPGSTARLLDVKKAIVTAKKLDQGGGMEFDLSVRDATTSQEYSDDGQMIPRGARLVVQRLPAARGHGLLAKIARSQMGLSSAGGPASTMSAVPTDYYTIQGGAVHDEDEFVSTAAAAAAAEEEDRELKALQAATTAASTSHHAVVATSSGRGGFRGGRGGHHHHHTAPSRHRPNADPELRAHENSAAAAAAASGTGTATTKKRATGIPRTFLSLAAPTEDAEGGSTKVLQPNTLGFQELIDRGGGQSAATNSKRDLEYALKVTATALPDYLACAICGKAVQDAMILPWDSQGRTTCERCIRNALSESGFRCPLTGQEGVSPDDLLPNVALRKAAEQFVENVWKQMEDIEKQAVTEEITENKSSMTDKDGKLLEGDDKGVILSKRVSIAEKRKQQQQQDDPFGDDDFGGDVFAVEEKQAEEEPPVKEESKEEAPVKKENPSPKEEPKTEEPSSSPSSSKPKEETPAKPVKVETKREATEPPARGASQPSKSPAESSRRDRRRGPPAGYSMGPAGMQGAPRGDSFSPRERRSSNHDTVRKHCILSNCCTVVLLSCRIVYF